MGALRVTIGLPASNRPEDAQVQSAYLDNGGSDMEWWGWVLLGVGAVGLLGVMMELPAIRRYMRIKGM